MATSLRHNLLLLLFFCFSSTVQVKSKLYQVAFVGENAFITCRISETDQDGVYLFKDEKQKIKVAYFYKDGTFTPYKNYESRVLSNKEIIDYTVTLFNVTLNDSSTYYCQFNKVDMYTYSEEIVLAVAEGERCPKVNNDVCEKKAIEVLFQYLCYALILIVLVLIVVLVYLCLKQRCNTLSQYSVYEEMQGGRTARTQLNPQYESSQKQHHREQDSYNNN